MALSAPVKALALIVFIAAIAGATYAVNSYVGSTVESQLVSVTTPRATLNATGGHNVTFVVNVTNHDVATRDVVIEVRGVASGVSDPASVLANSTAGVFVTLAVAADAAPGEHPLDVRIVSNGHTARDRAGFFTLRILPPAPGLATGDAAEVIYTGRLTATGRVFNTDDAALFNVPFPKTDSYRFSQGALPMQTGARQNVVPGLAEGMIGMQPGESRTLSFPPAKGYGPATEEKTEPRDEVIVRDLTLVNDAQSVPRATFDSYVNETNQTANAPFHVGSVFKLNQNGNDWPYRITNMSADSVSYKLAAVQGDAYTVYPFWANASIVTAINDTAVSFRTTPNTAIGQNFTMREYWPQLTSMRAVNDTVVVVRHSPPVGFTYTMVSQLGQPREATVLSVSEEKIVVGLPATNPLAGKDLTFDVTVLSLAKAPGSS